MRINRWGHTFKPGMLVEVRHPRGDGWTPDTVESFPPADSFSQFYGRQVRLVSGRIVGLDDCRPVQSR